MTIREHFDIRFDRSGTQKVSDLSKSDTKLHSFRLRSVGFRKILPSPDDGKLTTPILGSVTSGVVWTRSGHQKSVKFDPPGGGPDPPLGGDPPGGDPPWGTGVTLGPPLGGYFLKLE